VRASSVERSRHFLLGLIGAVALFAGSATALERPRAVTTEEAPREILRAVLPSAWLLENHVRSELDGGLEGHLLVEVQIQTRNGFQIYEDKTSFWSEADENLGRRPWEVEVVEFPKAFEFFDPISKTLKRGYRGEAIFRLKLKLPEGSRGRLNPGAAIPLVVGFQACNDRLCLFPAALRLDLRLAAPTLAPAGLLDRLNARLSGALSQGGEFGFFTIFALLVAGLLTAFTPCVYPLYPITIGIFGRWSAKAHVSPLRLALAYCGGLTLSYALLGLVSAATGAVFGSLTQKPAFLIGVGVVILISAAGFSGLFEFTPPSWLLKLFGSSSDDARPSSPAALTTKAAFMGAGLGIVAGPCVGPVLVVLLAWLSTRLQGGGSAYLSGFFLLAVFGIGMSLPFLAIGHLIVRMGGRPTLGRFTPYFKHLGTALMIGSSAFFLVPGLKLAFRDAPVRAERRYPVAHLPEWTKTRPTVIDFRADWCTACLQLEAETYPDAAVSAFFEGDAPRFDFVEVDLTETSPTNDEIAKRFSVVSLPTVLFARPGGEICATLSLFGFENASAFRARLERAERECR